MAPGVPHIRLCPALDGSSRSLPFPPLERDIPDGVVLKLGRFAERRDTPNYCITFRSKVVSRTHAEIWYEEGSFLLKDCKSSSGTFLNNIRLSPAGVESSNFPLRDGDIIQLGVEYQGGSEGKVNPQEPKSTSRYSSMNRCPQVRALES
jgi:pSer/pThr/pTyr-binding forkhead associated (FHA) protein